jgi:hypothetical protein
MENKKNEQRPERNAESEVTRPKKRKVQGNSESSGGSRQGNIGHQGNREGAYGRR